MQGNYIRMARPWIPGFAKWRSCRSAGWHDPYEWSHHVKIGFDFGVSDDIRKLIAGLLARTRISRRLTDSIAGTHGTLDGKVSCKTFAVLEVYFSEEHLVDLLLTMAFYNAVVRFLASTEMDVEESYQPYLDQFPLPK